MSWLGRPGRDWRAAATVTGVWVLVAASIVIGVANENAYWLRRGDSLAAQAGILAGEVEPALVFQDAAAAREAVGALAADRQIEAAGVYDGRGRLIAHYARDSARTPPRAPAPGRGREQGKSTVAALVLHENKPIGSVFLRTEAEPMTVLIGRHAGIVLLLLTAMAVLAILQTVQLALTRAVREGEARAESLRRMNLELEDQIHRREAAEEALRQAQKMETLGQLTGGIAHDFNNLLQSVQGSLDLIGRRPEDAARVRRLAAAGLEAAERGARLTAQLLAFSRAQKLEMRPLDLAAVAAHLGEILPSALGPAARVVFDLEDAPMPVVADVTQLEVAVLNLCINARDAMPDGGEVTVRTRRRWIDDDPELPPGDYMLLSVSDTGAGMTPEVQARAFEPFFTTKKVGKGTGLGLAQVYGIARQAAGAARIDSTEGVGTTVTIYLPRIEQAAAAGPGLAEARAPQPPVATEARILVIDDDAGVRAYILEALETFGYAPMSAGDGPTGLRILSDEPVDLLIVDYAMPLMTGAEVARSALAMRPTLPILFVSGYAETEALERAVSQPIRLLRKPFDSRTLGIAVQAALSGPTSPPAAA
jgi:signal transduction histidine kinase/ActR/RegA family two-component response regulator